MAFEHKRKKNGDFVKDGSRKIAHGTLPPSPNSNANPKPNPDPDRGTIFLGGNIPDEVKHEYIKEFSIVKSKRCKNHLR